MQAVGLILLGAFIALELIYGLICYRMNFLKVLRDRGTSPFPPVWSTMYGMFFFHPKADRSILFSLPQWELRWWVEVVFVSVGLFALSFGIYALSSDLGQRRGERARGAA